MAGADRPLMVHYDLANRVRRWRHLDVHGRSSSERAASVELLYQQFIYSWAILVRHVSTDSVCLPVQVSYVIVPIDLNFSG